MPKEAMYCDRCQKVTLHKQKLFQKAYWKCRLCKEERLYKRSKSGWVEERIKARQREFRRKKHKKE